MKLIFLDIDNTLLDFDKYTEESLKNGFKHFSLPEFEPYMLDVFHRVNDKLWRQIEEGTLNIDGLRHVRFQNFFEALHMKPSFDPTLFEAYYRSRLYESAIPVKGAYEMLEYLSKKYILATASNGPYEQQMHRLSLAKMDRYFTYFFISERIGVSKPSPLFFSKAFEEINANRSEIILSKDACIIGDSLTSDMKGGLNAGIHTCFFNKKGIDNLPKEIDFVLSDLSKISDVL